MKERYEKIKSFALQLNRYARRKGVALQVSSRPVGASITTAGESPYQPWIFNRESYPNDPVYSCMGPLPWFKAGATGGGCLANDALIDRIAKRQKQLVQDVEPASIYLHNVDYADYATLAKQWKGRCARCRERFPDDEPYSPRGYAAAVLRLYNRIIAELKSVRNPASGYDASRDLEIVFASPGYTLWSENDAEWEKGIKYFSEIGRQLTDSRELRRNRTDGEYYAAQAQREAERRRQERPLVRKMEDPDE